MHSLEVRRKAQELYICGGWPCHKIAQSLGVSVHTLHGWSKAEGWDSRRRQYQGDKQELRELLLKLKVRLAQEALESGEAKAVSALASLIRADKVLDKDLLPAKGEPPAAQPPVAQPLSLEEAHRLVRKEYGLDSHGLDS